MKPLFRTILIVLLVMTSGMPALAQSNENGRQLSREELAVRQAQYIAQKLELDKSTTDQYVKTYCLYVHDVWALGPRKDLTTEQRLERSHQILDLRRKYQKIYSRFLTEEQLEQAYRLEKQLLDRMGRNRDKDHKQKRDR